MNCEVITALDVQAQHQQTQQKQLILGQEWELPEHPFPLFSLISPGRHEALTLNSGVNFHLHADVRILL